MRTARDITFNEAELAGRTNTNTEDSTETTTSETTTSTTTTTTTTTTDSDPTISETVGDTAPEPPKPNTFIGVVVPPRDLKKIYEDLIDDPTPIPIALYTNTTIDDSDTPLYAKAMAGPEAHL